MSLPLSVERTKNYFRQVRGSFVYKIISLILSFITIPIMIDYLGVERFGVWSTILMIMTWIVLFDLGVGNGLKNRVTEALAKNDCFEAKNYISSGYTLLGMLSLCIWAVSFFCSYFIPWRSVFNTSLVDELSLRIAVQVALTFVALNFWLGLIAAILNGFQKTSLVALGQLYTNAASLILVLFAWRFMEPSITVLAIAYGVSALIANFLLSFNFYSGNRSLIPSYLVKKKYLSPLLSMGLKFFIIQIAVLVIFTTDKLLIIQFFGPGEVAHYEVIMKVFALFTFAHALISAPLWPAYSDAFHRNDTAWIFRMLLRQLAVFCVFLVGVLVAISVIDQVVFLWVGKSFVVSRPLVYAIAIFVVISMWNNIFAMILNGLGAVNIQLISALIAMFINIPLAFLFVKKFGFGAEGIVFAAIVSLSFSAILLPLQVFFLVGKRSV